MASARLLGVKHRRSLYNVTGALEVAGKYDCGMYVAPRAAIVLASKAVSRSKMLGGDYVIAITLASEYRPS